MAAGGWLAGFGLVWFGLVWLAGARWFRGCFGTDVENVTGKAPKFGHFRPCILYICGLGGE